jgi:DNA-directed RNA polymerase subunit RPC12/RpoP
VAERPVALPPEGDEHTVTGDKTFKLKIIPAPKTGYAISAPPSIVASDHSNLYICGHCSTLLVVAETGQLHGLVVRCRECGSYNAVDT